MRPVAGSAILWFNHELTANGSLGAADLLSMHGGCRLRQDGQRSGSELEAKWVANHWIEASEDLSEDDAVCFLYPPAATPPPHTPRTLLHEYVKHNNMRC